MSQISVIVPIYKVERYLRRCVDSILSQTFSDLEVILVDDGSPDQCGAICDEYAAADPRVKVIHKPNGGLSSARNAGIEAATGEYLAFIDSDDWLDADMFGQLHRLCTEHNAQIAECSFRSIYKDAVVEETPCTAEVIEANSSQAICGILEWKHFKPLACNKLYHRSVIGNTRYPEGWLHEDEFTTYKFFAAAKKLVYLDVSKYNYDRSRTDSITGEAFREGNLDVCFALRERREFLHHFGFSELEEQDNNVYCWILLDKLYKCYQNKIKGPKVDAVLTMAREDAVYFQSHPVQPVYLSQLQLLRDKGLKEFGRMRDKQQ